MKAIPAKFKRFLGCKFSPPDFSVGARILRMLVMRIQWTTLLPGTLASLALALSYPLVAQSASPQSATPEVHRIPYPRLLEIHVDQDCHILPPSTQPPGTKKPRLSRDPAICHLESVTESDHLEETIAGNQMWRSDVRIKEQTYVLQNVTTEPATFVVEQLVPEGWMVDSDPQPTKMGGPTAVFQVYAQPGETVQLHVGLRHTKPLRTRLIKTSPLAPAESNGR